MVESTNLVSYFDNEICKSQQRSRMAFAHSYFEVYVALRCCSWTLVLALLCLCILNENDKLSQKCPKKVFRWGTCYIASKRHMELHMVRYDDRNHCHVIWAWSKWNDGTKIQ